MAPAIRRKFRIRCLPVDTGCKMKQASFRTAVAAVAVAGLLGPLLQGCTIATFGAASTAGAIAIEERGLGGAISDTEIRARINALWFDKDERMWRRLELQVHKGRALLTGVLDNQKISDEAVRLAWRAKGVREVINEIQIGDSGGAAGYALDTKISAELKSRLALDAKVASQNYSVTTTKGVVYMIGSARNQTELDLVNRHARNIGGVQKVISYVQTAGTGGR